MGHDIFIDYTKKVRNVLIITLILNAVVAAVKVIYGYHTHSISITSDGFHSLFDGLSNVIGLVGIWIASHPPDEKHPYGHKKFEHDSNFFYDIPDVFTNAEKNILFIPGTSYYICYNCKFPNHNNYYGNKHICGQI
jgi:hypothetical protein